MRYLSASDGRCRQEFAQCVHGARSVTGEVERQAFPEEGLTLLVRGVPMEESTSLAAGSDRLLELALAMSLEVPDDRLGEPDLRAGVVSALADDRSRFGELTPQ